jgi:hypothetical protein
MIATLLIFILGLVSGLLFKGININIVHKSVDSVDKPKEYNQSLVSQLPPEVQNYYNTTQGQNKF